MSIPFGWRLQRFAQAREPAARRQSIKSPVLLQRKRKGPPRGAGRPSKPPRWRAALRGGEGELVLRRVDRERGVGLGAAVAAGRQLGEVAVVLDTGHLVVAHAVLAL